MSTCPFCGKEASAEAAFCASCGASLTAATSQPTPPSSDTTMQTVISETAEVPISMQLQTATVPFDPKASRIELLVRIVWDFLVGIVGLIYAIGYGIIIMVYSVIAGVLNVVNFFIILITAKRWKTAFDWQATLLQKSMDYNTRLYNYTMRRAPYFSLMTDKRPSLEMETETKTTPGGSPA